MSVRPLADMLKSRAIYGCQLLRNDLAKSKDCLAIQKRSVMTCALDRRAILVSLGGVAAGLAVPVANDPAWGAEDVELLAAPERGGVCPTCEYLITTHRPSCLQLSRLLPFTGLHRKHLLSPIVGMLAGIGVVDGTLGR